MKWTLITHDYPPKRGGVARYLRMLTQTCQCVEPLVLDSLPGRVDLFKRVLQTFKQVDGVITSHVLPIGTMCYFASFIHRKPYVVVLHGTDFDIARRSFVKRCLVKQILRRAHTVVTNSHALAQDVKHFALIESLVVHPCVEKSLVEASGFMRAKHMEHDRLQLLTVSRLVERKGHMRVLACVRDDETLEYTIVGNGPMRGEIEDAITAWNLSDRVRVFTTLEDRKLPDLYSKSDVFIMPTKKTQTDREGFGIVYLEAQLFGLPVIAADHPEVREALSVSKSALLVDDASQEELMKAIHVLKNPQTRVQMGEAGREFVLRAFIEKHPFDSFCHRLCD